GPEDAAVVIVLLAGGSHHAGHADAVAAHQQSAGLALFVEYAAAHGLAVLAAQLEDMPDPATALAHRLAVSSRAGIPFDPVRQVGHLVVTGIASPVDAGQVLAVLIGAADEVGQMGRAVVGNDLDVHADRTDGARLAAQRLLDLRFAGEGQRSMDGRVVFGL